MESGSGFMTSEEVLLGYLLECFSWSNQKSRLGFEIEAKFVLGTLTNLTLFRFGIVIDVRDNYGTSPLK